MATRYILDRAGFRPVDLNEIVKEKTKEDLNVQFVGLVGENGAEMLVNAFRSRRSISGHEMAGWIYITPKSENIKLPQCQESSYELAI